MTLDNVKKLFYDKGCSRLYVKALAANDNSKNQVYLGGNFEILNIFPFTEITADDSGDWKKTRFKAKLQFHWLSDDGTKRFARHAQLILYPKYPEVRFSGFLLGCEGAPSELMTSRQANRVLFFGVDPTGRLLGYVAGRRTAAAREFLRREWREHHGVFKVLSVKSGTDELNSRQILLNELARIHNMGWIDSKRLRSNKDVIPCNAANCGGYTLEAELGITPNGYSEPDFMGWEIKQFNTRSFENLKSSRITLMTPEPTGGHYKEKGVDSFIRKFGYPDKTGRPDRLNFGGVHKVGERQKLTGLTMLLDGFDSSEGKIRNSAGSIALVSDKNEIAASWSFASLLKHWRRKHALASYVPSQKQRAPHLQYTYGNNILLGTGARFDLLLQQMNHGHIFYDPGIKMENVSTKPKIKRRSQFRLTSKHLLGLYEKHEFVDLTAL